MSIGEIKQAKENGKIVFGIRQVLKEKKKSKKKKLKVFVSNDAREETVEKLDVVGVEFEVLKQDKQEIAKELGLNFESEVYLVK